MKKILIAKTKPNYYTANIIGLTIIISLITWCVFLSIDDGKWNFKSASLWIALLLTVMVPVAIISILSSMKQVVVTEMGLSISYRFKKHTSEVKFSEIIDFKSKVNKREASIPSNARDTFTLTLADGRSFEFSQSQFDKYDKMKTLVRKAVASK
jgi:hypothetical protein